MPDEIRSWSVKTSKRLESGRLSRAEYEKAVVLSIHLAAELVAVYRVLGAPDVGDERVREAMRKAGLRE